MGEHNGTDYLDTVERALIDFDFEQACSVTLSTLNVYACLVCGKFFQGGDRLSPAFLHSLNDSHHVFLSMDTKRFYCLPDNYEINRHSPILLDILDILDPSYSSDQIAALYDPVNIKQDAFRLDTNKRYFRPGFIGLNNLSGFPNSNVVLQAMTHVPPIRDYFLLSVCDKSNHLLFSFSMFIKRMWNPKAYRSHMSPQLFLNESLKAMMHLHPNQLSSPWSFLTWFINTFNQHMVACMHSSLFTDTFQGELEINGTGKNFFYLPLDLPPVPLFNDPSEANIMPQISIHLLLQKYSLDINTLVSKDIHIIRLPKYLILYIQRFSPNAPYNPTIVTFPLALTLSDAKNRNGVEYRLIANISMSLDLGSRSKDRQISSTFRIDLLDIVTNTWYEIEDLLIKEIMPQAIFMQQSCIQIWEML
jgi:U4/U6.U5 tri-snRNP-associated protein 2